MTKLPLKMSGLPHHKRCGMSEEGRKRDVLWPPPFRVRMVLPDEDVFAQALLGAQARELEAADVLWLADAQNLKAAIVLEPDKPLVQASKARHAMQLSCALALAALLPAQIAIRLAKNGAILVNDGVLANVDLVKPSYISKADVPPWLILQLTLHLTRTDAREGGEEPDRAVLVEEGGEALISDPETVLAETLRHFRAVLDDWMRRGELPPIPGWLRDA